MDEQRQRNLEWLREARDLLRKQAERFNLATTFRGLLVFLGTILLITAALMAYDWFVRFPAIAARTAEAFPRQPGWEQAVNAQVARWRDVAVKWRAVSYLGPALIAAIPFVIVSMVRDELSYWLYGRVLRLPRHQAIEFVIEAVAYRFRIAETRRFAILLFASIGTFAAFLLLFSYDSAMGGGWLAKLWYLPVIAAIPVTLIVQRFAGVWRRVLEKMRLTSADIERFRLVRLVDAAVPLITFLFVLAVLLATVPHLLARANERSRQAEVAARAELDDWVIKTFPPAQLEPEKARRVAAYSTPPRPWGDWARAGGNVDWLDDFFPAALRFFGGCLIATAGVFLVLLFASPAPTREGFRAGSAAMVWLVALTAGGLISASWAQASVWQTWQLLLFQGVVLVAFAVLGAAKVWWTLSRPRQLCPSCDRSFVMLGTTCPVCGVEMETARQVGPDEFVVGQGLTTVHHKDCRIYKSSRSRAWKKFMTLRQALSSVEGEGLEIARPCKVCLGSEETWTGDPVWRSASNWARWVRRALPAAKA
ncbi:MAG: hypothetical protein ACLFV7_00835 [Phycisphaerae bacterium]